MKEISVLASVPLLWPAYGYVQSSCVNLMLRLTREAANAAACLIWLLSSSDSAHSSVLCVLPRACFHS